MLKSNKLRTIFLFSLTALLFSGCHKTVSEKPQLKIVASSFPCYDAVRAVLGENLNNGKVSLSLLIKPGAEVHSFDPTPQQIISIRDADLFVFNGGESDSWILRLNLSGYGINTLKLFDAVSLIEEKELNSETEESGEENPHEMDEHVWTSPANEIKIVNAVMEKLISLEKVSGDEILAESIVKNASSYISEIKDVDLIFQKTLKSRSRKFLIMGDRFPLAYFADYYGLEWDAAFNGCSTAVEADMKTVRRLINEVREMQIPCVFYIELSSHKIADTIAGETGVKAFCLQSVQNVTIDDFNNNETWVSLMKRNAAALENLNQRN